jgi:predicted small metal-binding protein
MPYLGKCINCNWACTAELQSEVKGRLKKHSEKRHTTSRHAVTQISREEYYFYRKFWDSPKFWRAYNGSKPSQPKPISVEGAKAGS